MSRLYNSSESCLKLGGCTPKTLAKWAKEAGIEPQQKGREQLYTLDQLRQIRAADSRKRVLLSDAEAFGGESSETRVIIERYEREVEELRLEITQLREAMHSDQAPDQQVPITQTDLEQRVHQIVVELLSSDRDIMALIRKEIEAQVASPSKSPRPPREEKRDTSTRASQAEPHQNKPVSSAVQSYVRPSNSKNSEQSAQDRRTWTRAELFAENWIDAEEGLLVSVSLMYTAHGIPETNIRRAIKNGKLKSLDKQLLVKSGDRNVWRTGSFNAEQRRKVWEVYRDLPWFNPCEICIENGHAEEVP